MPEAATREPDVLPAHCMQEKGSPPYRQMGTSSASSAPSANGLGCLVLSQIMRVRIPLGSLMCVARPPPVGEAHYLLHVISAPSSSGSGHGPLKAETRVQFPQGSLFDARVGSTCPGPE